MALLPRGEQVGMLPRTRARLNEPAAEGRIGLPCLVVANRRIGRWTMGIVFHWRWPTAM